MPLVCLAEEGRTKPRKSSGSCYEALIRRCPNRVTSLRESALVFRLWRKKVSRGTEISKYPEEKKSHEIPLVSDERTGKSLNFRFIGRVAGLIMWD